MKDIGKPCAGKSHARFDEGGQVQACPLLYQLLEESCFINESAYVELIEYVGFLLYLMVTHFYFQSLCVVIFRPDC